MPDQSPFRSPEVWVAVIIALIIALIVKVRTSAQLGWRSVLLTVAVAIGAARVAGSWASAITGLPLPVAAALVTLTAEGAMRWLLIAVNDPKQDESIEDTLDRIRTAEILSDFDNIEDLGDSEAEN